MKLKDLLQKLNDAVTGDKTTEDKEAVDVLHTVAPAEVFQVIFDRGHSTGLAKGTQKNTEAEGKVTAAETARAEAERQLKEFKDKHPEAAKLQEQYQADLKKKDDDHKIELDKKDQQIETERRGRARSDFIGALKDVGIDPDYAVVLADKEENRNRIKFNEKGETEVLQKGKEIAIVPSTDKTALKMLAEELYPSVPAKFQTSKAAGGGGVNNDAGGGGTGSKTTFDKIREDEKNRQTTPRGSTSTAADRLAGRRPEPAKTT